MVRTLVVERLVYSWVVLLGAGGLGLVRGRSAWPVFAAGIGILIGTVGLGLSSVPFVTRLFPAEARPYAVVVINGGVLLALVALEVLRRRRAP